MPQIQARYYLIVKSAGDCGDCYATNSPVTKLDGVFCHRLIIRRSAMSESLFALATIEAED